MDHKKTIGIFHYQVGYPDGVSLEIEKWKVVLEEMGYKVLLCAGDLGNQTGTLILEMYHHLPEIERIDRNAFKALSDYDVPEFQVELDRWVKILEGRFTDFILSNKIDILMPENLWSVALNLPAAVALENIRRAMNLPAIAHHHDFYWERKTSITLSCLPVITLIDKYMPPRDPAIKHVVINSIAQQELKERKGITAMVVPNFIDFDAPAWSSDNYSQDLRSSIGLKENDIVILQATRILPRKGIELAIDFVKAVNAPQRRAKLQATGLYNGQTFQADSRVVLVLMGSAKDDPTGHYQQQLKDKAQRVGVDLLCIGDSIAHARSTRNGKKIYSFWDGYTMADMVTYPSLWEGWGNQFLEALRAYLPIVLFEYAVYQQDIKEKGFNIISLGSEIAGYDLAGLAQIPDQVIDQAADQAIELLTDSKKRREVVEHNFLLGQKHYSLNTLRSMLTQLLSQS